MNPDQTLDLLYVIACVVLVVLAVRAIDRNLKDRF